MRWMTILCIAAASAWTAVSFAAYRDLELILLNSLVGWLMAAVFWAGCRVTLGGMLESHYVSRKARVLKKFIGRNRVAAAWLIVAAFCGVLVFTISKTDWFETRKATQRNAASVPAPEQPHSQLWSVQVAAFRNEQDAAKLASDLKRRGYNAYVMRAKVNTTDVYQTKVGRFKTRDEAERFLLILKDREAYTTAFVTSM